MAAKSTVVKTLVRCGQDSIFISPSFRKARRLRINSGKE